VCFSHEFLATSLFFFFPSPPPFSPCRDGRLNGVVSLARGRVFFSSLFPFLSRFRQPDATTRQTGRILFSPPFPPLFFPFAGTPGSLERQIMKQAFPFFFPPSPTRTAIWKALCVHEMKGMVGDDFPFFPLLSVSLPIRLLPLGLRRRKKDGTVERSFSSSPLLCRSRTEFRKERESPVPLFFFFFSSLSLLLSPRRRRHGGLGEGDQWKRFFFAHIQEPILVTERSRFPLFFSLPLFSPPFPFHSHILPDAA